jgi:tRNA1(Val) A37 N6-methylase TrmN6
VSGDPSSQIQHITEARRRFPRGLCQPDGGFRFGSDSLLLASFARLEKTQRVLDLGTGCGVIASALLLQNEALLALGLDKDPAMAAAARENAEHLGLRDRFSILEGDVAGHRALAEIEGKGFDLVVSNPPYRRPESGRPSSTSRETALAEDRAGLGAFAAAAAYALENLKPWCVVLPAERTAELLRTAEDAGLRPKRLRFVHSRADEDARLILLEAVKNGRPGCRVQAPLVLYEGQGEATRPTKEALAFCPHLKI